MTDELGIPSATRCTAIKKSTAKVSTRGDLTTGQRESIRARRDEIHGYYRDLLFLETQYAVMHRQGIDDYDEFCGIFLPDTPFGALLYGMKGKAG